MDGSLWSWSAGELLRRTASAEPTPGGGSVAAVSAALGLGLVLMSVEVTLAAADREDDTRPQTLGPTRQEGRALLERIQAAADRDTADFAAVMAAYRLPRETPEQTERRREAVDSALETATRGPLELAEQALAAIDLADAVEPSVSATVVSDTRAGRDLLAGAARAALHTVDINLGPLERRGHPSAPALRARRDAVAGVATPGGRR